MRFGLPLPMPLFLVACCAIAVRFFLFAFLMTVPMSDTFLQGDSMGYLQISQNIIAGHGFSQSTSTPYLPDGMRTPGFTLIIAASQFLSDSYLPVILLQILLAGVLTILSFFLARLLFKNDVVAYGVALCVAFEPFSIAISLVLLNEIIFTLLFLLGTYASFKTLTCEGDHLLRYIVLASIFFGLSALIKPIAQFLPLILLGIIAYRHHMLSRRSVVMAIGGALIPFLLVLSPWLLRNHGHFGTFSLSSGGFQNVYSDFGASILAVRDHLPYAQVKSSIEKDFAQRHDIPEREIQENIKWSQPLFYEGLDIIVSNPIPTTKTIASLSATFFTHDLWVYYFQKWGMVRPYEKGFSPTHTLLTEGPLITAKKILSTAGPTLLIPVLGRVFWVLMTLLFIAGMTCALRKGGEARATAVLLAVFVLYFLVLSLSGGVGMTGRYRFPVNVLISALALWYGLEVLVPKITSVYQAYIKRNS